jgi:protein-L-isoaspartate(D-aspartate) O-methyltransferase
MSNYINQDGVEVAPEPSHFLAAAEFVLMLRQKGIRDINVLRAMEQVARASFCLPQFIEYADYDVLIPLPCGQVMLPPSLLAKICELVQIQKHEKVLCIGAGNGYFPALLSRLSDEVIAIERVKTLIEQAHILLKKQGYSRISLLYGDGLEGHISKAPYDKIILTCAVTTIPQHLMNQLGENGVLIAPVGAHAVQSLSLITHKTKRDYPFSVSIPKARTGLARFI